MRLVSEKLLLIHKYSILGVYWCVAYNLLGHQSIRFEVESGSSINCETTSTQISVTPYDEHSSSKTGQSTTTNDSTRNDQSYTTNSSVTDRNEHLSNPLSTTQTVAPDWPTASSDDLNTSHHTTITSLGTNRIQTTTESGTVPQSTRSQESHSTTPYNVNTQNGGSGADGTIARTHFNTEESNDAKITRTPTVFTDAESDGDAEDTVKVATLSFVGVTLALLLIVIVARVLFWHCHPPNTHKAQTTVANNEVADTGNSKI